MNLLKTHPSTRESIETLLTNKLNPTFLEIIDDSAKHAGHAGAREHPGAGHYKVTIVSAAFAGKSLVARHRMVYDALGDLMREAIHALALTTKTPEE